MRIVQISDLHIGGLFRQDIFDTLVNEINNDLKPDVVIISGDITDDGLIFQFEAAKKEIKKIECENRIIFPGNHDYRHTGYLLFNKYFPTASLGGSKVHEFKIENDDKYKAVITVVGTARADRDEGEVGIRQNQWLDKTLRKYNVNKKNGSTRDSSSSNNDNQIIKKIVAMHHHLIAIPDTGYTNVVGISDAGDVLRTCLANNVDLVICGHKHRPWLWDLGKMKIAYAGTACSWRYRGVFVETYNIIDINKNKEIQVDMKIVGGKRFPLSDIVDQYDPNFRITKFSDIKLSK